MEAVNYNKLDNMLEEFGQAIFVPVFHTTYGEYLTYLRELKAHYPQPAYSVGGDDVRDIVILKESS